MIQLQNALKAWGSPDFEPVLKQEMQKLDKDLLPLQEGLSLSSHVSASGFSVVVLDSTETPGSIRVKTGIFYAGIIAGSCCSDDPTPLCDQAEYCEILLEIDKTTAETRAILLNLEKALEPQWR